jgi:hypothetical protein
MNLRRAFYFCMAWLMFSAVGGRALHATVVYVSMSQSYPQMIGSGTTDSEYVMQGIHTAYATVTVYGPNGRQATNVTSYANRTTTYTYLDMAGDDGYFSVSNVAREYCPAVMVTYSDGTQSTGTNVSPYVYMSSASWTKNPIQKQLGDSKLKVVAGKSPSCNATSISLYPNIYANTPGLLFHYTTVPAEATFEARTATAEFSVSTDSGNPTGGTLHGDGGINSQPCPLNGPGTKAATPDLTVNAN